MIHSRVSVFFFFFYNDLHGFIFFQWPCLFPAPGLIFKTYWTFQNHQFIFSQRCSQFYHFRGGHAFSSGLINFHNFYIIPMPSLILSFFKKLILCFYKKPPQSLPMPDIELPKVNVNGRSNGKANGESGAHFKRNGVRNGRIIEEPMNQANGQKRSSVGGNELSYKVKPLLILIK